MDRIARDADGVEARDIAESGPAGAVRLPGVKAPALAAFERAAAAVRTVFAAGEADPFLGPCPPWCQALDGLEPGEAPHLVTTRAAGRRHESAPIAVPVNMIPGTFLPNGGVQLGRLTVGLESFVAMPTGDTALIALSELGRADDPKVRTETSKRVATLTPREGLDLARALATAARLADPDLNVDGLTW